MKRRLFFWLEKLKITPVERKTISGLMVILSLLSVGNLTLSKAEQFGAEQYSELQQQFEKRTAALKAEEQKRMQRYFPSAEKSSAATVVADTIPPSSSDTQKENVAPKKVEKPQKSRINVNKADRETLKSLPGIGPAYSKRIIVYRKKHGGFKTITELKKIKGIGEKRLEKLKPFVKLKDSE